MNSDQPVMQKEIKFFKLTTSKKVAQGHSVTDGSLSFIVPEQRRFHQVIRQVLKDFQYFQNYQKQELNLSEGERVLKTNGIKIIRQNDTYFIQKYFAREESVINWAYSQKTAQKAQNLKIQFTKTQTISNPRYLLSLLGYSTKQKDYYRYLNLQCYKCPAFGIQIIIFDKWQTFQYVCIDYVCNYQGNNPVGQVLFQKLSDFLVQDNDCFLDPYTLRPRSLKHGQKPQL